MKSTPIALLSYAVVVLLIGLASTGCDVQYADGSTESDRKKAEAESSDEEGDEREKRGYLQQAQDLLDKAKGAGQETVSEAGEWINDTVGSAGDAAEGLGQNVSELYESLRDRGMTSARDAQQWVQEDFQNMYSFEYKILPKTEVADGNLESTLNELGRERWDCFEVDEAAFYFKRQKKSYLRNVPVKDLLRFLPMGVGEGE